MKAIVTPRYGTADVFETQEMPTPVITANEVLVEVHASPVTAGDRRMRSADFPGITMVPGRLMMGVRRPRHAVQGTMFAGRVVAVGDAVKTYAIGDDVFGFAGHGAYAEYVAVSTAAVARIPSGVGYVEAAAVPYGAGTAVHFLRTIGQVAAGEKVLILGAAGGVGRFAVQYAKHLGAEVTAVCRPRSADLVRELGADHVIDFETDDFTKGERRYDVVFDIADATTFGRCRRVLTPKGRYLTLSASLGILFQMAWTALIGGQQAKTGVAIDDQELLDQVRLLLEAGVFKPVLGATFPYEGLADAHRAADAGGVDGCLVVLVRPAQPATTLATASLGQR